MGVKQFSKILIFTILMVIASTDNTYKKLETIEEALRGKRGIIQELFNF